MHPVRGDHPERTSALILWSTFPRAIQDDDFPEGWLPVEAVDAELQATEKEWTEGTFDQSLDETWAEGLGAGERPRVVRWWERLCRMSLTPGAAVALSRIAFDYDVRDVLPTITAPTLCIVRAGDENVPATRYLAQNIAGARFVELPGSAHVVFLGPQEEALAEIQKFLTGVRPAPEPSRVLATVLFADIVSSTERLSELGDRVWSDLLETFLATVRGTIQRFDGREVDAAGDGIFAAFDGPRGRSAAGRRYAIELTRWVSSFVSVCTPVSASASMTAFGAWRSTSAHESRRSPRQAECSCRAP